jgi:hypothetical protein
VPHSPTKAEGEWGFSVLWQGPVGCNRQVCWFTLDLELQLCAWHHWQADNSNDLSCPHFLICKMGHRTSPVIKSC